MEEGRYLFGIDLFGIGERCILSIILSHRGYRYGGNVLERPVVSAWFLTKGGTFVALPLEDRTKTF
jgi:hypothetical protein